MKWQLEKSDGTVEFSGEIIDPMRKKPQFAMDDALAAIRQSRGTAPVHQNVQEKLSDSEYRIRYISGASFENEWAVVRWLVITKW